MSEKVYEIVNERITAMLERGETPPWHRPWRSVDMAPRNVWGRKYNGINTWLLLATQMSEGYKSPYWMTFNQAKERGGAVKKGAESTLVTFWKQLQIKDTDKETGETKSKRIPLLRYYRVFNADQVEGVKVPEVATPVAHDPIEAAEAVVKGMPSAPAIHRTLPSNRAYYEVAADLVVVPPLTSFDNASAFYSVLFHELGHATGHATRLSREGIVNFDKFGSMNYGREELIAEMTAAYLCGETGISPAVIENSAAYLSHWLKTIDEDPRAVVVAAGAAQKAADYILNRAAEQREIEQEAA